MKQQDSKGKAREGYHHGNLREALVQAALAMIAERGVPGFAIAELARILGVSTAAPTAIFAIETPCWPRWPGAASRCCKPSWPAP